MGIVQGQRRLDVLVGSGLRIDADRLFGHHLSFGIFQGHQDLLLPGPSGVPNAGLDFSNYFIVRDFFLDHMQAVRPVFLRREEDIVVHQQADGIVQATVLVEVGTHGNHLDVLRVVAHHFDLAAVRERYDERRIAAFMGFQESSVQVHFRRLGRAFEEQEGILPGGEGDFPAVMGLTAVILLRRPVQGVVGVRDRYGLPLFPVPGELPVLQFGFHGAGAAQEGKGHEARDEMIHTVVFFR